MTQNIEPKPPGMLTLSRRSLLNGVPAMIVPTLANVTDEDGDWLREGGLGPQPERRTDNLPLSDQQNAGGWVVDITLTDEFAGDHLDLSKWSPTNPEWKGRLPAIFSPKNVRVADGQLHIDLRREALSKEQEKQGYRGWTAGAVQSRNRVRYGYFEVRSKPMKSRAASTFWFYATDPDRWTEIDVYEVWPGTPGRASLLSTNLHIFDMPGGKPDHAHLGLWTAPFNIADDYHVYGLEWTPEYLQFFVDGVLIRRKVNTSWHQPLTLNLDVEIMPTVGGVPDGNDDVMTYSIDYVRCFKKSGVVLCQPNGALK